MSDAYWDQTVALLHFDGANNATVFTDDAYGTVLSTVGSPVLTTANKKFGNTSLSIPSGSCAYGNPESSDFGPNDFTVEFWVNTLQTADGWLLWNGARNPGNGTALQWNIANISDSVDFAAYTGGTSPSATCNITTGTKLADGKWHHIAVSRNAGYIYCMLDGVQVSKTAFAGTLNAPASRVLNFGGIAGTYERTIACNIDEVRITKGVGRYTTGFMPQVSQYQAGAVTRADDLPLYWNETKVYMPLAGDYAYDEKNNALTKNASASFSASQKLFGTKSLLVASGAYGGALVTNTMPALPASADFTDEFYCYLTAYPVSVAGFCMGMYAGDARLLPTGELQVYAQSAGVLGDTKVKLPLNTWNHIALCRQANVLRLFLNGVSVLVYAGNAAYMATATNTTPGVGGAPTTGNSTGGYYQMFRTTYGVARYTGPFVPPTKLPKNYTTDPDYDKVVFHCHFNGPEGGTTFVDQKGHTVTAYSTGALPTTSSGAFKFGNSAANFLGNNSQRIESSSPDFMLETGDFTIEAWVYYGSGDTPAYALGNAAGTDAGVSLSISSYQNRFVMRINGVDTMVVPVPTGGTWYHTAIVRAAGVITVYVNGTPQGTYSIGSAAISSNGSLVIGNTIPPQATAFSGRVEEMRITKGLARYTNTFSVPTAPFPDYMLQKLTGTVRDPDGNPISRKVRSFRSSDGLFVDQNWSDPVTGAFSLRATDLSEHFVLVHDDTKNALVYDHVIPVI